MEKDFDLVKLVKNSDDEDLGVWVLIYRKFVEMLSNTTVILRLDEWIENCIEFQIDVI